MRLFVTLAVMLGAFLATAADPGKSTYWSDYRGPDRAGVYSETEILTEWPGGGLKQLWKVAVGDAFSGMTVAEGRVFTIEQRKAGETVAAFDFETGKELWAVTWDDKYSSFLGGKGPRATPVWDEGRLYAQGAQGELKCLNAADGKEIWSKNLVAASGAKRAKWGVSVSPLVHGKLLVTVPGAPGGKSVVALDKMTEEPVWSSLEGKPSYASPVAATLADVEQILIVNAAGVHGVKPDDGAELWHYPWTTSYDVNAAQPVVVDGDRFLISSGYGHGAALVKISGGAGGQKAEAVWVNKNLKNKFNTSVYHDGHFYGLDETILTCIDAETGARKWKAGRYGFGQVLRAGGHLIITAATGEVVLVKATPEGHQEISRFQAVDGKTWNTPALAAGRLLVRSVSEMACFRIAP